MSVHDIDRKHAKLSASSSGKWLVCTPSAQLEDQIPDEQSPFAAEGTLAHSVFEMLLKTYLSGHDGAAIADYEDFVMANGVSQDMLDHVGAACQRAVALIESARDRCPDPVILLERRLDFSPWVPEGFGTGDLVIITDDLVEVADLKFGKGVLVDAVGNSQMRLYGLGAYNELNMLYNIQRVKMHVFQPRMDNWSCEEISVADLLDWAEKVVVPQARIAWDGEGELVAGDHCSNYFCRARFTCPARNAQANALIESSFALLPPDMLNPQQMSQVLSRADEVIGWLNDVKTWCLAHAEKGNPVPGFKLVEGRSNRKYKDADAVAKAVTAAGVDEALIYERSIIGLTAMEKLLGKKKFADILGNHIEKPRGKPTLVPVTDKRPVYDALAYFETENPQEGK
jgi:hypothetical protein